MEQKAEERIQDWPQHQGRNEPAPQQRRGREKPARQEEGHSRRRYQAVAQIVEDLPPVEGGKRVGFNPASAYGNARLQPVNDLPVATNPAVLPIPPRDVTARKDIQQLDVRREPHADITTFQQIVTQQVRRWKSFGQEAMKRVQFVDAFAVITAFSDQVLVNIGDGVRVGIDPALLALAPRASAMKKKEAPRSVPAIQFLYSSSDDVYILCVLRHALSRRVRKIGQERKAQIPIRISEVTNFEAVEFVLDCVRGGQQQRHHHQRAAIIGNAFFFEGHFGQDLRRQERGREIIHGQYRQLTRRQEQQKSQQPVCQPMNRSGTEKKRRYDHRGRKHENASEV